MNYEVSLLLHQTQSFIIILIINKICKPMCNIIYIILNFKILLKGFKRTFYRKC